MEAKSCGRGAGDLVVAAGSPGSLPLKTFNSRGLLAWSLPGLESPKHSAVMSQGGATTVTVPDSPRGVASL